MAMDVVDEEIEGTGRRSSEVEPDFGETAPCARAAAGVRGGRRVAAAVLRGLRAGDAPR
jgi:hypothetical protein